MPLERTFSIVTNFGCTKHCFFCAFANHRLKQEKQAIAWDYLEWCIGGYSGLKVSISGGGDPLFKLEENFPILKKIIAICRNYKLQVDLHTNEDLLDKLLVIESLGFQQIIVSTHTTTEIRREELMQLQQFSGVRAVVIYVGQDSDWLRQWIQFYSFVPQLTVRECRGIDFNFNKIRQTLQNEFPQVRFLADGDYNYYYMPDNLVYDDYEATRQAQEFMREGRKCKNYLS